MLMHISVPSSNSCDNKKPKAMKPELLLGNSYIHVTEHTSIQVKITAISI